MMRGRTLLLALAVVLSVAGGGRTQTDPKNVVGEKAISVSDLSVHTLLRQTFSDEPHLRATQAVGDERVTIFATETSTQFRERLAFLLNHDAKVPAYLWNREDGKAEVYLLKRSGASLGLEQQEMANLSRQAYTWLGEMRDGFRLEGEARRKAAARAVSGFVRGDAPSKPSGPAQEALKSLDDQEFRALVASGKVTIPSSRLSEETISRTYQVGEGARPPEQFTLSFAYAPASPGAYFLTGNYAPIPSSYTLTNVIDPLGTMGNTGGSTQRLLDENEPCPLLKEPQEADSIDPKKSFDLSETLEKIAKRAHVTIYCEYFPPDGGGFPAPVKLTGPLHKILNEVATTGGYNVVKHDGAYFLWGRRWFIERPNLPPGIPLDEWLATARSGKPYTLEQLTAMYALSDGQVKFLSRTSVGIKAHPAIAGWMRFIGALSPAQLNQAFSTAGLDASFLTQPQLQRCPADPRIFSNLKLSYDTQFPNKPTLEVKAQGGDSLIVSLTPVPH